MSDEAMVHREPGVGLRSVSAIEKATIRAISLRILPILMTGYFLAYLDRVNLGFAAPTMNAELQFSPLIFSWGAGLFFIGYFLFEVPSNLALHRYGARRWFPRIIIGWGIVSMLMALVSGPWSFYILRFVLGVVEAGFFPGVVLYLTYWYPARYRARVLALFTIVVPISTVIGGPVSGVLLGLDGWLGLRGWQWMFILEGLPSVLFGIFVYVHFTDRPENSDWLLPDQRAWLTATMDRERAARDAMLRLSVREVFASSRVMILCVIYFGFIAALYGLQFWMPTMVSSFGYSPIETGLVTAIPYLTGAIVMMFWARHSDRTQERVYHVALPLLLTAVSLAACWFTDHLIVTLFAITLAAVGVFCAFALFWTLPTAWLGGAAAAAGIAMINAVGNLAGFGGPYVVGWAKENIGTMSSGLLLLALFPLIAGVVTIVERNVLRVPIPPE